MNEKMMDWLDSWGGKIGMFLVCVPLAYDLFWNGGRELSRISVGTMGAFTQLVGIGLIALARYCGKELDRRTRP